jgi:hypothetical protein
MILQIVLAIDSKMAKLVGQTIGDRFLQTAE